MQGFRALLLCPFHNPRTTPSGKEVTGSEKKTFQLRGVKMSESNLNAKKYSLFDKWIYFWFGNATVI
jgi:hypothetical protein